MSDGIILPAELDDVRQSNGSAGALFSHMHMSRYERNTASLVAWGIAEELRFCRFHLLIDAAAVSGEALRRTDLPVSLFVHAVEAFLTFDSQPGWPDGFFANDLPSDFRNAGLIEGEYEVPKWTSRMKDIWQGAMLEEMEPPAQLFRRVCSDDPRELEVLRADRR